MLAPNFSNLSRPQRLGFTSGWNPNSGDLNNLNPSTTGSHAGNRICLRCLSRKNPICSSWCLVSRAKHLFSCWVCSDQHIWKKQEDCAAYSANNLGIAAEWAQARWFDPINKAKPHLVGKLQHLLAKLAWWSLVCHWCDYTYCRWMHSTSFLGFRRCFWCWNFSMCHSMGGYMCQSRIWDV